MSKRTKRKAKALDASRSPELVQETKPDLKDAFNWALLKIEDDLILVVDRRAAPSLQGADRERRRRQFARAVHILRSEERRGSMPAHPGDARQ
jgi:hypothetical protein